MAKCYQYNHKGYLVGESDDFGGFLPANAVYDEPERVDGYIPRWTGTAWEQVEDHRGVEYWLPGDTWKTPPQRMMEPGPLPEGAMLERPEKSEEEKMEDLKVAFTAAIQSHLDSFAQTRNYDGIMSAATYAASAVPNFRTEGQYAVEARDATWAKGYEILDEVLSGQRPVPSIEEVIAELPPLAWPEV